MGNPGAVPVDIAWLVSRAGSGFETQATAASRTSWSGSAIQSETPSFSFKRVWARQVATKRTFARNLQPTLICKETSGLRL